MVDRIYGRSLALVFWFLIHALVVCDPTSLNERRQPSVMPGDEAENGRTLVSGKPGKAPDVKGAQTGSGDPLEYFTKGSVEISRLQSARGRLEGHPKLVALLVGEDYLPRPGGPG